MSMLKAMRKEYLGSLAGEQKESLQRCERRIELLETLIDDFLKLGLKRANPEIRGLHPVDMKETVRTCIHLYRSRAEEKRLTMSFDIDESIPKVIATEELVDELCTNLISNAVKYTPPGGQIKIILERHHHDRIRFEVSDTGIGIPQEDLPRLFTEFFRAENAVDFEEEGTGLGLVIVNEILDRLKGTISVDSRAGEGTRFICLIPAAQGVPPPSPRRGLPHRNHEN